MCSHLYTNTDIGKILTQTLSLDLIHHLTLSLCNPPCTVTVIKVICSMVDLSTLLPDYLLNCLPFCGLNNICGLEPANSVTSLLPRLAAPPGHLRGSLAWFFRMPPMTEHEEVFCKYMVVRTSL